MTSFFAQLELNEYTNRVLNVIKAKFGLKDKSEALNKFAEIYGENEVEREVNEEYAKKITAIINDHMKKHPNRRMTMKELDLM
jgi:hypothetical protein